MASPRTAASRLSTILSALIGHGAALPRPDLERELEEARRRGHWYTEEDRQLEREHEARLAAERRGELARKAGRGGAIALMVSATVLPLLWPLAILAGIRAFPTASRRLGIGLAIASGVGLITAGVVVVQLGRVLLAPEGLPAAAPVPALGRPGGEGTGLPDAVALGRSLAERIERATDYWILEGTSPDGTATWRKGLYQPRDGQTVMVLPRTSWELLTPSERRALASYVSRERDVSAIHLGRVQPSSAFDGNTISVGTRVWP